MAQLIIIDGPETGRTFELAEEGTIGRGEGNDIVLDDLSVSRRHARILVAAGTFSIEDLGSTNGIFVNNALTHQAQLKDRDHLKIGNFGLLFRTMEAAGETGGPGGEIVEIGAEEADEAQSIINTIDAGSYTWIDQSTSLLEGETQKAVQQRLRIVDEISRLIARTLDLDEVLGKIVEHLFVAFKHAERAFVMLRDEAGQLSPKVVQFRDKSADKKIRVSRTVVHEVVKNRKSVLSCDAVHDDRFKNRQSIMDMHIRSVMCTPLLAQDNLLGILYLDTTSLSGQFSQDDLSLLTVIGTQAALLIANAQLHQSLLRQQRLEQDLRFANTVQHSFLPRSLPDLPGYAFGAHYTPAYEVGGDFYDFVSLSGNRLGVAIGDVSGKGISAALMMARITSDLRSRSLLNPAPGDLLRGLNELFCEPSGETRFITLLYLLVDVETGELTVANAGHFAPLLRRQSGEVVELEGDSGLPLGVTEDAEFGEASHRCESGDVVVMCTDGVIEAMDRKGDIYGLDRYREAVSEGGSSPQQVVAHIVEEVNKFVEEAPQSDDLTLVAFGRE